MKQKVLVYCTQLMPAGGIENHVVEFCKNMSPYVDIDLLVPNFKMPEQEINFKKYCRKVYLIKSNAVAKRHLSLLKTLLALGKNKYDILYTNGIGASILMAGKMIRHTKWVLHHHMESDPDFFSGLDAKYKKAMMLADHVIACSETNAVNLAAQLNKHVDVVYCFSRDLSDHSSDHHTAANDLHFGYFGRLIPAKGIDLICRLSDDAECKDISFHIWGSGEEYPASFFQRYKNISYHGVFHTAEELKKTVYFLDAFLLLTTHAEGLPVSLLEIMSAGVPWISANKGGIPDIACDPLSTRITDVSNYTCVKRSVLQLAEDIKKGNVLRDKQKMLYKKNFAANVLMQKWISLYNAGQHEIAI
jgi:glycosyltransferase involved in cell wall biosynthesis